MKLADRVTTVTPTLRGLLAVSYRVPQSRIAVVYNGADPIPFDDTGPKDIDMIHLGSPRFYYDTIGFLSALSSPKFRELKPRVVFLGCTEEPYVQDVHDKIGALGLKGLVQMLPPVPPREVRHWLARAKAGVFTLSHEPIYKAAIGLKVFEYLASGLPVLHLGPSDGETARLIMRTQSGLVSETAEEFASNYLRFHADPALEATLSAAARSAGRTYTWAASGKAMADTLRGIRQPANDGWRSPERDPERMCARGGPGS
jgi:glycosyltransferase involved in cell wall biosynthesis